MKITFRVNRIQIVIERGLYQYLMDQLPSLMSTLVNGNHGSSPSFHEKISAHIEVGESDIIPIGWKHFSQVLYLFYTGLVAASIILFFERISTRFAKPKGLRRKISKNCKRRRQNLCSCH